MIDPARATIDTSDLRGLQEYPAICATERGFRLLIGMLASSSYPDHTRAVRHERSQRLCLRVLANGVVATHELLPGGRVIIGRTHESAIAIDSPQVSRQHAALELGGGQIWVEDLGSAHGTRARGAVVETGRRVAVAAGDVIELGSVIALLQHLPAAALDGRARRDDAATTAGPLIVDAVI